MLRYSEASASSGSANAKIQDLEEREVGMRELSESEEEMVKGGVDVELNFPPRVVVQPQVVVQPPPYAQPYVGNLSVDLGYAYGPQSSNLNLVIGY